jgi:low temperature requirement protein LtrA
VIPQLSYTNIAIVGLLQIGTIVAGVLGAGAAYKMWAITGLTQDRYVVFASEYGFLFLAVPMVWIVAAMVTQHRNEEDDPEVLTFMSGVALLLLLIVAAITVAVTPWVRLFSCSFSLSS